MHAGRVAWCQLLVSHVSMPMRETVGQTDGRQTVTLRFPLDADRVITRNVIDLSIQNITPIEDILFVIALSCYSMP